MRDTVLVHAIAITINLFKHGYSRFADVHRRNKHAHIVSAVLENTVTNLNLLLLFRKVHVVID